MYVIEIWARDPDTGAYRYEVVRTTRVRVNRIDEDGIKTMFCGVSYWAAAISGEEEVSPESWPGPLNLPREEAD